MSGGHSATRPAAVRRWDDARIGAELADFLDERRVAWWPTEREFRRAGRRPLLRAIQQHDGVPSWAAVVGLPRRRPQPHAWPECRIEAELLAFLGRRPSERWPTRGEFIAHDYGGLLAAIDRNGGVTDGRRASATACSSGDSESPLPTSRPGRPPPSGITSARYPCWYGSIATRSAPPGGPDGSGFLTFTRARGAGRSLRATRRLGTRPGLPPRELTYRPASLPFPIPPHRKARRWSGRRRNKFRRRRRSPRPLRSALPASRPVAARLDRRVPPRGRGSRPSTGTMRFSALARCRRESRARAQTMFSAR